MTPQELQAWAQAAAILLQIGAASFADIQKWMAAKHPDLPPDQLAAAYKALEDDASVRAAIAANAAGNA